MSLGSNDEASERKGGGKKERERGKRERKGIEEGGREERERGEGERRREGERGIR